MYGRYRDMFVCSLVDGHLGHFCFLAIRKKSCSEHSWVSFGAREFICVGLPRSRVAKAECRHIASCSKFSWFSKVVLQVSSSQQLMLHSISVPWYWHLTVPFFFSFKVLCFWQAESGSRRRLMWFKKSLKNISRKNCVLNPSSPKKISWNCWVSRPSHPEENKLNCIHIRT